MLQKCGHNDKKCFTMLQEVCNFATLSFLETIQKLTAKFKDEMQRDCVKQSYQVLMKTGKQAKFNELIKFVQYESNEVNLLYGRAFYGEWLKSLPPVSKRACSSA